ncbi:spermatogenesis-associated protein 46 [Phocoena sinus]|uniref:spermatogenesis-associated protein 46 n=1 Tax=Phocoena sinus TaxID=42100 RepID=UPI0013C4A13F|nr:spermatogenesis-associated protein 46 [Phocoena sinus]
MSAELRMFSVWTTRPAPWKQACVTSIHFSSQNMENFSLLSISGPRIASSALSTFPDITSSRATSLPGIAKTVSPTEASGPAQALLPQYQSSALRHGVHNTVLSAGCILGDPPNREKLRRNCTIYRPWFSPYSYFVCKDRESHLETYSFPEVQRDEGRGDSCLPEDTAESICSSSSSPENTCPQEATKKSRHGLDSTDYITSQDILMASKWYPAQQNGFKCAACCRMYPTLHSLKSHIKGGYKEGFSCKVYYRKLKTLWGKEQKGRPGDRLSSGSCQAFK